VLYGYPAGSAPTWWPDGSRLFFQDARDSLGTTTYQVNLDGTCEGKFLQGGPRVVSAAWRPGSAPALGRLHCADLRVVASAENDVAAIGKRDTLHFSIGNDGNERAIGASITFTASPGAIVEPNIPCHELVCTLPPIEPGGSLDVAVTLRSFEPDTTARVSGVVDAVGDSDISTNTAQVPVQVLRCTVVGTIGPDYLYGTPRADRICARPGADHIFAGAGNDYIDAGNGDDVIYPGPGRDTVIASGGNDVVYARDGQRDYIDCGSEHDIAVVDRLDVVHRCEVVARSKR
jgi:Ca2+-binding RTX toxin-like protein